MISEYPITKKIVYRHSKGNIRHMIVQTGWACQCFKDCNCNSDQQKANPDLAIKKEYFRIDAKGQNPKKNKFKTIQEAINVLNKL